MLDLNKIYCGDSRELLAQLDDESVDCMITSPPYWGLRDYGLEPLIWDAVDGCEHEWGDTLPPSGQSNWHTFKREHHNPGCHKTTIGAPMKKTNLNQNKGHGNFCTLCGAWRGSLGLEPTFQLYIQHLMQIFDEVWRVLKPTGTCWVNMGDGYIGGKGQSGAADPDKQQLRADKGESINKSYHQGDGGQGKTSPSDRKQIGAKVKSLAQIPSRFAIGMTDAGWILRNEIIWYKRNCMPSSAKDRFTVDFEKVFFFTKNKKYWFEQQREGSNHYKTVAKVGQKRFGGNTAPGGDTIREDRIIETQGRNKRCVWKIDPLSVMREIIDSDETTEVKALAIQEMLSDIAEKGTLWDITTQPFKEAHFAVFPEKLVEPMILAGCPPKGTVLDIFGGAGTVGISAIKHDRNFILFELNPEYIEIANKRIEQERCK